jgi:uncharacterized membrane protein
MDEVIGVVAAASRKFNGDYYVAMDTVFPVLLLAVSLWGNLLKAALGRVWPPPKLDENHNLIPPKKTPREALERNYKLASGFLNTFLISGGIGMALSTLALLWRFDTTIIEYAVFACFILITALALFALLIAMSDLISEEYTVRSHAIISAISDTTISTNTDNKGFENERPTESDESK